MIASSGCSSSGVRRRGGRRVGASLLVGVLVLSACEGSDARVDPEAPTVASTDARQPTQRGDAEQAELDQGADGSASSAIDPDTEVRQAAAGRPDVFVESFDGAPDAPAPWSSPRWDVTVHSRDDIGDTLPPMDAQHGPGCEGPPATHEVVSFEDSVFTCRDHLMTALNSGEGYAVTYLTPNRLVDFTEEDAVVTLDVSTQLSSTRDWWDLWITPYDDHLQLVGEDWYPDLQGAPRRAIHVKMETFNTDETGFIVEVFDDFEATVLEGDVDTSYEMFLQPDAKRRDTFELTLSDGRLRFGMPDYDHYWFDGSLDLDWTTGVVQIGHHSYNPTKDDVLPDAGPNTWHWDNVTIEPARPFVMSHGAPRTVDDSTAITFATPSSDGAHLRFAGIGADLEFSVDDGASWTPAQRQPSSLDSDEHHASYWTPIPPGVDAIELRGAEGWSVRDVAIWSLDGDS